jgi:uncharacterized protein (DUF58 family)
MTRPPWTARLALRVRRGMGTRIGDRRVPGRPQPSGIEIEAHAPYVPGDDLRHLDWNALARLDVALVRRFTAEREGEFHLLLDLSASMGVDGKLDAARALAAALVAIALGANDAVRLALLPGDAAPSVSSLVRRGAARDLASALDAATARGAGALGTALELHARRHSRPAVALVVSDFLVDPAELARGVGALRARRWDVALLQVLARRELDPPADEGLLVDAESGATHAVRVTPAVRAAYAAALARHLAALADVATATGALYARMTADEPVADFVTGALARTGLVRRR